ncbi:MAG TPA: Arm DNA-binding domain-containing protein [Steroidobacteraceae bacterium]|nr:Arm DNA-binding domain-containing protein [Steroidobacteraceae bacterium]
MALTDTKLQRLQAKEQRYQLADGGGLYLEVQPTGKKVWRMQYRLGGRGSRKERVTLGEYPAHTLAQARLWREQCRGLLAHGQSPAVARQAEKEARTARATDCVAAFADLWYADVVSRTNSEPRNIRRVLDKDVLPAIGEKPVADVTIPDILAITDAVKAPRRRPDGATDPQRYEAPLCLRHSARQDAVQSGRRHRGAVHCDSA